MERKLHEQVNVAIEVWDRIFDDAKPKESVFLSLGSNHNQLIQKLHKALDAGSYEAMQMQHTSIPAELRVTPSPNPFTKGKGEERKPISSNDFEIKKVEIIDFEVTKSTNYNSKSIRKLAEQVHFLYKEESEDTLINIIAYYFVCLTRGEDDQFRAELYHRVLLLLNMYCMLNIQEVPTMTDEAFLHENSGAIAGAVVVERKKEASNFKDLRRVIQFLQQCFDQQVQLLPDEEQLPEGAFRLPLATGVYLTGDQIRFILMDGAVKDQGTDYVNMFSALSVKNPRHLLKIVSILLLSSLTSRRAFRVLTEQKLEFFPKRIIMRRKNLTKSALSEYEKRLGKNDPDSEGGAVSGSTNNYSDSTSTQTNTTAQDTPETSKGAEDADVEQDSNFTAVMYQVSGGVSTEKKFLMQDYKIVGFTYQSRRTICAKLSGGFRSQYHYFAKFRMHALTVSEELLLKLQLQCFPKTIEVASRNVDDDFRYEPPFCFRNYLDLDHGHAIISEWIDTNLIHLSEAEVIDLTVGLLTALDTLHAHSFLHRDLRPENVLFDRIKRKVYLCDTENVIHFQHHEPEVRGGYYRVEGERMYSNIFVGTPEYKAPECIEGEEIFYSVYSDVFALGKTLDRLNQVGSGVVGSIAQKAILEKPEERISLKNALGCFGLK